MTVSVSSSPLVFDRALLHRHRDRSASQFNRHDFLKREVSLRLTERLQDTTRHYPRALDLGSHTGHVSLSLKRLPQVGTIISTDLSLPMITQCPGLRAVCDEEALAFAPDSFDLVTSCLSLHWVNDLPGVLTQIHRVLKPDGLFLAALLGGETLRELRQCLTETEITLEGGLSPRLSPVLDLRDLGMLLQRAGFSLPVADCDTITVSYDSAFALMHDLRGMGETNMVLRRRKTISRRSTLFEAARLYHDRFATGDGRIPATFQVLWLTAWRPSPNQPKALPPGSATHPLEDALARFAPPLDMLPQKTTSQG